MTLSTGVHDFAPLQAVANLGFVRKQVCKCTKDTFQPADCQMGAVAGIFSAIGDHVPNFTPHPYRLSYQTGAPEDMWTVAPTKQKTCDDYSPHD